MRVYIDSSALVKRGVREACSDELEAALDSFGEGNCYSSVLGSIEVSRALRSRLDHSDPSVMADLIDVALSGVHEVALSRRVSDFARRIGSRELRSLDAIHLASATLVNADLVVAYDARLLRVASELGFATVSPGVG